MKSQYGTLQAASEGKEALGVRPLPQFGGFCCIWMWKVMGRNNGGRVYFPMFRVLESAELARHTDIVKGVEMRMIARKPNGERTTENMTCRKVIGEKMTVVTEGRSNGTKIKQMTLQNITSEWYSLSVRWSSRPSLSSEWPL